MYAGTASKIKPANKKVPSAAKSFGDLTSSLQRPLRRSRWRRQCDRDNFVPERQLNVCCARLRCIERQRFPRRSPAR